MHRISSLTLSSRSRLPFSSTARLVKIATSTVPSSSSSSSSSPSSFHLVPSSRPFSLSPSLFDSSPPPKRRSSPPKVAEKSSVSPGEPPVVPDYPSEVKPGKFVDLKETPRPSESDDPAVRAAVAEEPAKKESELDPLEKEIKQIEDAEKAEEDKKMKERDAAAAEAIKKDSESSAAAVEGKENGEAKKAEESTVESAEDVLDEFFDKPGKPKRKSKVVKNEDAAADGKEGEEETPLGGKRKKKADKDEESEGGGWFGQSGGKGEGKKGGEDGKSSGFSLQGSSMLSYAIGGFVLYQLVFADGPGGKTREINYQEFRNSLLAKGLVHKLTIVNHNQVIVTLNPSSPLSNTSLSGNMDTSSFDGSSSSSSTPSILPNPAGSYYFTIGSPETFERQLKEAQDELGIPSSERIPVTYKSQTAMSDWVISLAPTLLLIGFFAWSARKMSGGMGGGAGGANPFNVGKSKAKQFNEETDIRVKFADVAGMDEAKVEIMEFVKFLKQPAKFLALGAKIPRGAILSGPPGTGKTLIAKATAGEAGVPFFSVSGSEFVEMFVGVGSSRVRDLFAKAKKAAPAIIFIDEIDAIGKKRGKGGSMGGNDERESTLNQLLVEMDGFGANEHIVVLAGTNRSDVLDNALMRPGRFDRHIAIDNPDVSGRRQIFMVHLKPLTIHPDLKRDVIAEKLSLLTPGFSGADIANVCNEAALHCARREGKAVEDVDFETAIERVIVGLERKSRVLGKDEKRTVAYHEAGHAVCGWFLEHADPLLKVSIIPRGVGALGYAQYLPKERFLYSTEQLMDRMCMTLGGRVSEEIFFSRITTGASDDLQKVTKMAFQICSTYGMNETIGPVSYQQDEGGFQKPFSEKTGQMLDDEVRKLVQMARERTRVLLTEKRAEVELVAQRLLEREVLTREAMVDLLGKRPFDIQDDMDDFLNKYPKMKPVAGKPAELTPPPMDDQPGTPSPVPVACAPTVLSSPSSSSDRPASSSL